ncbi:ABC-type transport auxiliary lipoprotein family protein [Uruburuella testudinis]|uniref:ABC-type transport auxiliary lipoprotein family protein n=1 Tax=Uruburuella testudinis TaxID=1282863 RepID=A0ABY4DWR3_9NEIS|nr:ABC-type transport auxiliary lipoprotein family protein [Uruburuella testudinis]UOO81126.1 ABC-type transport auxiliary lipoprotein family protein [Uruburuella testudinis]
MRRLFSACAAASALAACSTPQTTQYFTLPDSQYSLPAQRGNETAVRVILAEPLANGGLVYQTDAYHVNFARNHLWAGALDNALAASFSNKLNRLNPHRRFMPANRSSADAPTLKIYMEAFQGSYQGQTQVRGYAVWPNGQGRNFNIDTPQQGDGYTAMVESLDAGVNAAAAAISE